MRWLQLRPGEGAPVAILVAWYFCVIGVTFVLRSVRDALFLGHLSADALPAMYIAAPIVVTLVGIAYARIDGRVTRDRIVVGVTGLAAIAVVAVRLAIHTGNWVFYVLYVLADVISGLTVLQLWMVASDRFTARDAKRVFGLIGAGGTLAGIAFGAVLAGLSTVIAPENLLFVCGGLLATTLVLAIALRRVSPARARTRGAASTASTKGAGHLALVGTALVCATFVTTLVDFQFKAVTAASFGADRAAMVAFFGKMSIANSVVSLAIQLFAIRWALGRLGVVGVLLVLPIALAGGEVALSIVPTLIVATVLKSADQTFRYTLNDAASQLLFLPVPSKIRGRWKAMIDNAWKPLSQLALGLGLLGYRAIAPGRILPLVVAALAMTIVWLAVIGRLRSAYARSLRDTLRTRPPELDQEIDAVPREEQVALRATLASDDPVEVLAALELVEAAGSAQQLGPLIATLCLRDDDAIRLAACRVLAICNLDPSSIELVRALVESPPSPSSSSSPSPLSPASGTPASDAALGVLLANAEPDAIGRLLKLPPARAGEAIEIAARGWHARGIEAPPPAIAIVAKAVVELREAAVALATPALLPALLAAIGSTSTMSPVSLRSVSLVDLAVARPIQADLAPAIAACARGAEDQLRECATHPQIVRALGLLATPAAIALLVELVVTPPADQRVVTQIARSLERAVQASPDAPIDHAKLRAGIDRELRAAYLAMAAAEGLGRPESAVLADGTRETLPYLPAPEGGAGLISRTLRDRQDLHRDRAFALVAGLYPRAGLDAIYANLREPDAVRRANAIELLDATLDRDLRNVLVPLVDEAPRYAKLAKVATRFALPMWSEREWIAELARDRSPWMVACTEYYLGAGSNRAESSSLTVVEKVMLLKGVELFAAIPSDELAAIARIAHEHKIAAGETLMEEGDHGDALFVVVAGRAKIFTGERTINEVGERAVIGELALLDPGPRAASVEALTDLVVLRLGRDEFVEILAVHPDVPLAVIKMLARRVREAIA